MASSTTLSARHSFISDSRLLQNMKDYTSISVSLIWQRQAIFLAATILTGFFFDRTNALYFYGAILICEGQDLIIGQRVRKLRNGQHKAIFLNLSWILVNTILSATAISLYAVSVALKQDAGDHFTPLFFLFAAALFAAMNNHQIVWVLTVRLAIYGTSFLVIVLKDIVTERPDMTSDLWLQFFTIVFVMYFLIDCSFVFLKLYRRNLEQLDILREEHERTKAAYVAKSQFISTVSHELRTPLTSIKGSLDLINTGALGPVPPKIQNMIEMATRNSARLSSLINDVLDLQKIEAGEMKYRVEVVNIDELICDAVYTSQGLADKHDVTIEKCEMEGEPLFVEADESRLLQVMANMISNAAKFSRAGGKVSIGCSKRGDMVRIHVKDEGIGIPEGSQDKVFDRFAQIDSSDERHVGGTGLGMNISKEIVEHFNGKIDYESELGVGTTFFIELPEIGDRS